MQETSSAAAHQVQTAWQTSCWAAVPKLVAPAVLTLMQWECARNCHSTCTCCCWPSTASDMSPATGSASPSAGASNSMGNFVTRGLSARMLRTILRTKRACGKMMIGDIDHTGCCHKQRNRLLPQAAHKELSEQEVDSRRKVECCQIHLETQTLHALTCQTPGRQAGFPAAQSPPLGTRCSRSTPPAQTPATHARSQYSATDTDMSSAGAVVASFPAPHSSCLKKRATACVRTESDARHRHLAVVGAGEQDGGDAQDLVLR